MRDWSHDHNFNFGFSGGEQYIAEVLKVKDDQSPELKAVREYISSSFDKVLCFLMPHPGLEVVKDQSYDGRFSRLDEGFQEKLKELLNWLLVPKNLKKKRVLDALVTGATFNEFVKTYFETFQSPETPKIQSIYEATIERQFANFIQTNMVVYKEGLKEFQPDFKSGNFAEQMAEIHEKGHKIIILRYNSERKMGTLEHENEYRKILENEMRQYYDQWKEGMLDTLNKINSLESKNEAEKQKLLEEHTARLENAKQAHETQKNQLVAEMDEREKKILADMQLKDEEKEEAIRKLREDNKRQKNSADQERQKFIEQMEQEKADIIKQSAERARLAEEEMKKIKEARESQNSAMQLQLQKDREDRIAQMKKEADDRKEERRQQQEKMDKEDELRKEEMQLLRDRIDQESRDRQAQLQQEENRRQEERQAAQEQRKADEQIRQQALAARNQERLQQQAQFNAQMLQLQKRRSSATTSKINIFCLLLAVGGSYIANLILRKWNISNLVF